MSSCGGGGGGGGGCVCQSSSCSNSNEDDVNGDSEVHTQHRSFANFPINGGNRTALCSKCGQAEQVYRGTCVECFRSYVFGKFKLAVTSNAMIAPMDKGQGYSLPADLQYVDARWDVPVVLPLRDCIAQELSMLCQLDRMRTHLKSAL